MLNNTQVIDNLLNEAILSQMFPGCALGVVSDDLSSTVFTKGKLSFDSTSPMVTAETVYDLASLTKSIPTALLMLQLIEVGEVRLNDPLEKFLPETKNLPVGSLLISDVLSYWPDLGLRLSALKDKSAAEILEAIFHAQVKPQTQISYQNAVAILLGLIIEKVTSKKLSEQASDELFNPLAMTRTSFTPIKNIELSEIAPTEEDSWRNKLLQGEVDDESAWKINQESKKFVGSAGLFSCVTDLLQVVKLILNRGEINDFRFISETGIEKMAENRLAKLNMSGGLGWELNQAWMGQLSPESQVVGKTGFTGCFMAIDLKQQQGLVFLSNMIHPHRPTDRKPFNAFRQQLCQLVLGQAA